MARVFKRNRWNFFLFLLSPSLSRHANTKSFNSKQAAREETSGPVKWTFRFISVDGARVARLVSINSRYSEECVATEISFVVLAKGETGRATNSLQCQCWIIDPSGHEVEKYDKLLSIIWRTDERVNGVPATTPRGHCRIDLAISKVGRGSL